MHTLLINPPYQTLTSNRGVGHQVPLGLLAVGGPLRDAGHDVRLLDAECRRLGEVAVVLDHQLSAERLRDYDPETGLRLGDGFPGRGLRPGRDVVGGPDAPQV